MKKTLCFLIIIIGFILVTFFGLGPVIMADGGRVERIGTLTIVIGLYAVLAVLFRYIRKKP